MSNCQYPKSIFVGVMREMDDWMANFSVSVLFSKRPVPGTKLSELIAPHEFGSGALLTVGGRHFLITAGHVVSAAEGNNVVFVPLSSSADRHRLHWVAAGRSGDVKKGTDCGYFELADASIYSAAGRTFLQPSRLATLGDRQDVAVFGFPREAAALGKEHAQMVKVTVIAAVAGRGEAPVAPTTPGDNRTFDLWLPASRIGSIYDTDHGGAKHLAHELGGMSGGGVWSHCIEERGKSWDRSASRLVGVYVGSMAAEAMVEGEPVRFGRVVRADSIVELLVTHAGVERSAFSNVL